MEIFNQLNESGDSKPKQRIKVLKPLLKKLLISLFNILLKRLFDVLILLFLLRVFNLITL